MLENPIVPGAIDLLFLRLALSGVVRQVPGTSIGSTVLPGIFLASYVLTQDTAHVIQFNPMLFFRHHFQVPSFLQGCGTHFWECCIDYIPAPRSPPRTTASDFSKKARVPHQDLKPRVDIDKISFAR